MIQGKVYVGTGMLNVEFITANLFDKFKQRLPSLSGISGVLIPQGEEDVHRPGA